MPESTSVCFNSKMVLSTERLVLRELAPEDLDALHLIYGDDRNREYFPEKGLSRERVAEIIKKCQERYKTNGFGFWATILRETNELIGFVGINIFDYFVPFEPKTEVGWVIDWRHAGKGYATEAAMASMRLGFDKFGMEEIVAITAVSNWPSRRVMEKLGMKYDPDGDFDHIKAEKGHPLARCVLYRLKKHEAAF